MISITHLGLRLSASWALMLSSWWGKCDLGCSDVVTRSVWFQTSIFIRIWVQNFMNDRLCIPRFRPQVLCEKGPNKLLFSLSQFTSLLGMVMFGLWCIPSVVLLLFGHSVVLRDLSGGERWWSKQISMYINGYEAEWWWHCMLVALNAGGVECRICMRPHSG